jgi:hypothetical protein
MDRTKRAEPSLSPEQLLVIIRRLYHRLRNDRDHRRSRRPEDEALVHQIRAYADQYRALTD